MPESTYRRHAGRRALTAMVLTASLTVALAAPASAASSTSTGPNTATAPYVLPVADGVHIRSLLTVGEGAAGNGYELVGIPNSLGATKQGSNIILYMNHELRDTQGIARRHGETGAFVSRWVIDPRTGRIKDGSDHINPGVRYWDYPSGTYVTSGARWADGTLQERTFGRFC